MVIEDKHVVVLEEGASVDEVSKALESIGLKVLRKLRYLNMIIVEGTSEMAEKAKSLEGVKTVEKNKTIELL